MTLQEALKTGLPLKRKNSGFSYWIGYGSYPTYISADVFMDPEWFLSTVHLSKKDILAEDWQVKEKEITLTKSQLIKAMEGVTQDGGAEGYYRAIELWSRNLIKYLGF